MFSSSQEKSSDDRSRRLFVRATLIEVAFNHRDNLILVEWCSVP